MSAADENGRLRDYAGSVDVFDPEIGIRGWAADRGDPGRAVTVRLVVAGVELLRVTTGQSRPDVAEALDLDTDAVGFAMPPEAFDAFLGLPDVYAAARPEIYVEDSHDPLPGLAEMPVVARCRFLAQRRGMPNAAADPFSDIGATLGVLGTEAFLLSLEPQPGNLGSHRFHRGIPEA